MEILWLAAADARGHLMRAHLMRSLLAPHGVDVRVVTTSRAGVGFLRALGTPAELLGERYAVAFDGGQNLRREETEAVILRYLTSRDGAADLARLARMARRAALVVNDFHPLPLVAGASLGAPVAHVYGEGTWACIEGHFAARAPQVVDRGYSALVRTLRDRAAARVEHSLAAPLSGERRGRAHRLPPILAAPTRSREEVRASLGITQAQRLAAVYLNPYFRDASIARSIEDALAREGFVMHAVGEGFASRPGWRPYDPRFVDVSAAADVLVAAPGMGSAAQAKALGVPLVALVTDQPEQRHNARALATGGHRCALVHGTDDLTARVAAALHSLVNDTPTSRPPAHATVARVHRAWTDAFLSLLTTRAAPAARPSTTSPSRSLFRGG